MDSENRDKHQSPPLMLEQRIAKNTALSEAYIKRAYPNEQFISKISELKSANKYCKGLVIPVNVKVAVSRLPINSVQRDVLRKELLQAEVLAKVGYSVFLTPERGEYKVRVNDAIANGVPYEFRNITGKNRQVEQEFSNAKKKSKTANIFLNIDSEISRNEVKRRIRLVLERHPEYTGMIAVSWKLSSLVFWDTDIFR